MFNIYLTCEVVIFNHGKLGIPGFTFRQGKVQEHSELFLPYKAREQCPSRWVHWKIVSVVRDKQSKDAD